MTKIDAGGGVSANFGQEIPRAVSFADHHRALLDLYSEVISDQGALTVEAVSARLPKIADAIRTAFDPASLIAYERYLDLLALRFRDDGLKTAHTLLDKDTMAEAVQRDPSRMGHVIGLALEARHRGDTARCSQLLRRVAASGYPEARLARQILAASVIAGPSA